MANKIKFDRDNVVNLASKLFWQKGFHATSTRDLQNTIDMRPGSIYAAFGSKEGLYCEALKSYTLMMQSTMERCLLAHNTVLSGMKAFVREVIIADEQCQPSDICMLVKANAEFSDDQPLLKSYSEKLLNEFELYIESVFNKAKLNGELSTRLSTIEYARFFQIQFTGLRSYLHRPQPEGSADHLIDNMFNMIEQL